MSEAELVASDSLGGNTAGARPIENSSIGLRRATAARQLSSDSTTSDDGNRRGLTASSGYDTEINYDAIYEPCFTACSQLLETMNKYRKKRKQPPIDKPTNQDWKDVEESVQAACDDLHVLSVEDKDFSGSVGKIKKAFRVLCRHAGAGETFAALIPSDQFGFGSMLCGGIKTVFSAMRQAETYRQEVYTALEELPFIICDHAVPFKEHNSDELLHRRVAALYVSVFKFLRYILQWFLGNSFVTGMKIMVNPSGFTERFREVLAEVKVSAQRFEKRALRISQQCQDETLQLQYRSSLLHECMSQDIQVIRARTERLEDRLSRADILENFDPFVQAVADTVEKRILKYQRRERRRLPPASVDETLDAFQYDQDLVFNDCRSLLKLVGNLSRSESDQSHALRLQSNYRVRAWLTTDEPSMLLVNGRTQPRPDSEVSLLVARISSRILEYHESRDAAPARTVVLPLVFFCGQHRDRRRDVNSNPTELAMSLFLQLVDRGRQFVDSAFLQRCRAQLNPRDAASICRMLGELIARLRENVFIVIIIDGLRYFAQMPEACQQLKGIVSHLTTIYRSSPAATLKFLFSSPTRVEFLEELFKDEEILNLPRSISYDDSLGVMKWKRPIETFGDLSKEV